MNGLDWFIARRYLASRKRGRFLSFITWIALGGVTVGVTALIVVIGVMTGMQEDLRNKILESTPHVLVLQHGTSLRMDGWRSVLDTARTVEGVEEAAPFILTEVAIRRGEYAQPADLYGISLDPEVGATTSLEEDIRDGVHSLEPTESGLPPLLVGSRLAERMQVLSGDTLILVGLENFRTGPLGEMAPSFRRFEVTGTFSTGMFDYDIRNLYAPMDAVQNLLDLEADDRVSGIGVRTDDPDDASRVAERLRARLGFPYFVESWLTRNSSLLSALKLEKLAMMIILFLIVVVAAFNIVSTLIMVVVDRTREIGILKSMGMTDGGILRVFMLQGMWIGIAGTLLGGGAGLTLCWLLDRYEIVQIPPDIYFVDRLPVSLDPTDVLLIIGGSILVSFAATIYPAIQASKLDPVEAIRHE